MAGGAGSGFGAKVRKRKFFRVFLVQLSFSLHNLLLRFAASRRRIRAGLVWDAARGCEHRDSVLVLTGNHKTVV